MRSGRPFGDGLAGDLDDFVGLESELERVNDRRAYAVGGPTPLQVLVLECARSVGAARSIAGAPPRLMFCDARPVGRSHALNRSSAANSSAATFACLRSPMLLIASLAIRPRV
jgi:hypothetical protein